MSTRKTQKSQKVEIHEENNTDQEFPYKQPIGHLQSLLLLMLALGSLEIGFIYTTLIGYVLMTIAFYEMIQVQAREKHEDDIQIKTKWVNWYSYFCVQYYFITRTWLTQDLLHNSNIVLPVILDDMLFKYHSFYTFCLLASGMILFVLSLQEGHYAYQFKQLGWSMLNLTVIVTAGHGHLVGLWKLRLWFVYTISCMCLRDMVDNIVSNFLPIGLPLHSLSPKSSVLGYIIGGVCAFAYYFYAAQMMLNNYWFNVSPTKLGLTPFDYQSVHVDTSSNLFKIRPNHWEMGPIGELKFDASPIQIHLFVITCFVAIIAPFGALFFTALKRALKAEQLGQIFTNGGVIDKSDCLLITGLFLFIYVQFIVYQQQDALKTMQEQILQLSPKNQKELYDRLLLSSKLGN